MDKCIYYVKERTGLCDFNTTKYWEVSKKSQVSLLAKTLEEGEGTKKILRYSRILDRGNNREGEGFISNNHNIFGVRALGSAL